MYQKYTLHDSHLSFFKLTVRRHAMYCKWSFNEVFKDFWN